MASSLRRAEGDESSETSENRTLLDPRLDFFSTQFDPLFALTTPGVEPPKVDAKIYDNVSKYESVKKQNIEGPATPRNPRKMAQQSLTPSVQRNWLPHQLPVKTTRKDRSRKDVVHKMETMGGPFTLLNRCRVERIRLKIWTRHCHGIRGYCLAYLTAFDKHWNMTLEAVTEVWTRPKRRKIPALDTCVQARNVYRRAPIPKITVTDLDKKTESCERYVNQLLLRGEHVVMIVLLEEYEENEAQKQLAPLL